jgi:hypothetical protein
MQTKKMSIIESTANYAISFALGWILNIFLFRAFGYPVNNSDAFLITAICMPIVLVKNYLVRRLFNRWEV